MEDLQEVVTKLRSELEAGAGRSGKMSNCRVEWIGREAIVAAPWRQLCNSLLHNWDLNTHSSHKHIGI